VEAKLDFVRKDVPNVRSLTFLSLICPTPPLSLRYPANHSAFILSRLPLHSGPPRSSSVRFPRSSFFLRAEIPVSPETLDDVAPFPHVPRYYAYFTDFYGIPRRLLSASPSFFLYVDYVFYFIFQSFTPFLFSLLFYFSYFIIDLLHICNLFLIITLLLKCSTLCILSMSRFCLTHH